MLNSNFEWKELGVTTGTTQQSLPNAKELSISIYTNDYSTIVPFHISYNQFYGADKLLSFTSGSYISPGIGVYARLDIDIINKKIALGSLIVSGNDVTSTSKCSIFYR